MGLKSKGWTGASIETEKNIIVSFFRPSVVVGFSFCFLTFACEPYKSGEEFSGAKTSRDLTWITIPAGGVHRRLKVSSNSSPAPHSHFCPYFCQRRATSLKCAPGEKKCSYGLLHCFLRAEVATPVSVRRHPSGRSLELITLQRSSHSFFFSFFFFLFNAAKQFCHAYDDGSVNFLPE